MKKNLNNSFYFKKPNVISKCMPIAALMLLLLIFHNLIHSKRESDSRCANIIFLNFVLFSSTPSTHYLPPFAEESWIIMDQICCIMVVDGFSPRIWTPDGRTYRTVFLVRELSFAKLDQSPPKSFRFDLRDQIDSGSIRKNGKTLAHQSKMIGLSVHPASGETGLQPYSALPDIVRDMHRECSRDGATLVGHKGGHNESALLESLGIRYADLQLYGCPKYDLLARSSQDGAGTVWDCGCHNPTRCPVQCPMAKVVAYRDWCSGILKSEEYSATSKREEIEE